MPLLGKLPVRRVLAAVTAAVVLAACGGGDKGGTNPPPPPAVATVELSQPSATIKVGDIVTLSAVAKGSAGQVLTGRTEVWTTSNSNIASVSQGAVTGLAPGVVQISVTIEGKIATATITVELLGVATISVSPQNGFVQVGGTLQLSALLRDASGSTILGRAVSWSSSDQTKATVDLNGVVTGIAPGTVTITATAEGKTGTAPVTVTLLPAPTIGGITPATLAPGVTATITGTNFSTVPGENTVTVAGTPVTVTAASATQLTVVLPAEMPCLPTGPAPVVVTTGGGPVTRMHPLQVALQRSLAVGEPLLALDLPNTKCNEFLGGSRYLVSIFNSSPVPSARAAVEIGGASASAVASLPPLFASRGIVFSRGDARAIDATIVASRVEAMRRLMRSAHREHLARLELNRTLVRNLGSPRAQRSRLAARTARLGAGAAPQAVVVPTTIGATTTLKVPRNSCSTAPTVTARVVYSGAHTTVLEDVAGPLAGQLDTVFARFGQLFENVLYPIEDNFGDINAADEAGELDNPGKVIMLFTPQVNNVSSGLLGFVISCDFYDPTDPPTAASNKTKIFYARTALKMTEPDPGKWTFDNRELWSATMPATMVHEAKHLTAYAERLARNADSFEESWLEEATAQIASELYGRTVWQTQWRQGATYQNTIYCELRNLFVPGRELRCNNYTYNVTDNFLSLSEYYENIRDHSFLSQARDDQTVYGSAWLFVRWLTDQYAGSSERTFLRSLVQEPSLHGVQNVTTKTGKSFEELLGYYTLSLLADDYPGFTPPPGAKYTIPSWNTRDIFAGLYRDEINDLPFPLATDSVDFGSFNIAVSGIAGGSASYLIIKGTPVARQLLNLSSLPTGSPIRLAIVRVQ